MVLKVSSISPRFFSFVSFFGEGAGSGSPFFPFLFGDLDLLPGLVALLSGFLFAESFNFSWK